MESATARHCCVASFRPWRRRSAVTLIYLDNAATTQKPQAVLDAIAHYYRADNASVHRAAHALSGRATRALGGRPRDGRPFYQCASQPGGDLDPRHHGGHQPGRPELGNERSCNQGTRWCSAPWSTTPISSPGGWSPNVPAPLFGHSLDQHGDLDAAAYRAMLGRTRLVSVAHVSNALGTVNPVKEMVAAARAVGALTLIDGAQAVAHLEVDVQAIGCDSRLLRPQALRPDRDRRTVGTYRAAGTDAPGKRGRDDRPGQLRRHHLQHPALQV